MADWTTFDADNIPFIQEATIALQALKAPLAFYEGAATAASLALGLSASILESIPDPGQVARDLVDELITDLVNTGIFTLIVKPDLRNRSGLTGVDGFARTIKNAFNDEGDVNRPAFVTGDDTSGMVFLISAPSFEELAALAAGFQILFGSSWQELLDFVAHAENNIPYMVVEGSGLVTEIPLGANPKVQFIDDTQQGLYTNPSFDPFAGQRIQMLTGRNAGLSARVGSYDGMTRTFTMQPPFRHDLQVGDTYALSYVTAPSPPDWQSLRVVDNVPIVAEVTEVLASLRDAIPAGGQTVLQGALVDLLNRKAAAFGQLSDRIDDVIELFDSLDDVPTINVLTIPPQPQGNNGFMREVFNAGNAPIVGKGDFTMGIVLYGGSGVLNVLSKIFPV